MESREENIFEDTLLRLILNSLHTNIYVTDVETDEIVYMNHAMKETFRLKNPEGQICWKVLQTGMTGRCSFCRIPELIEKKKEQISAWNKENTATGRMFKNYASLIKWKGKTYHVHSSTDETDYLQLSQVAAMDELTGVPNRRAGKEKLEEALREAGEEKKILTVALYDVNDLKTINDTYGHIEGDRLLKYLSDTVREMLAKEDFMFRLSGDEFVVVFRGKGQSQSDEYMKQVISRLKGGRGVRSFDYEITFSYGLTQVYPGELYTASDVISRADEQMYIQKRNYHIMRAKQKLRYDGQRDRGIEQFEYDKEHLYEALIAGTDDYIFVGNMQTGVFRYPPAMVEEFGLPGQVVENAAAFWGPLIHPHDESYFLESNQDIADGREEYHNIEYRAKNVRGEWIWLRCRGKMIRNEKGKPGLFAGMITNLGKKNQIDHMTGLYNRFEFEGDIKKYLVDTKAAETLGVMILDMDSFQNINDLYNRSFGDEILRITAQRIASILPSGARIYRLDGDEFGVTVLDAGAEECIRIFRKIQQIFKKQQQYNGKKYFTTLSGGCTFYPKDADNYLDLLKYANYSLEASKNAGKNRITVYSPDILKDKERNLELTELLRESIERGFTGFTVCYQPQVNTVTKELYGAEALARWECDKYGNVPPAEFVPLLEQSGMIIQFGNWIFQQAARKCKEWVQKRPDIRVSINLSYLQLLEEDIVSHMKDVLSELKLKPGSITMELTENYLVKEDEGIRNIINNMRGMGIRFAMDDFGVGYSSLYSLKSIPVDIVKIDRGFVKDITKDTFNATFIRSITDLCHNVGKQVCLEGVETEEEYRAVAGMGLELIQGFYFGRPVLADEFEKLIRGDQFI